MEEVSRTPTQKKIKNRKRNRGKGLRGCVCVEVALYIFVRVCILGTLRERLRSTSAWTSWKGKSIRPGEECWGLCRGEFWWFGCGRGVYER